MSKSSSDSNGSDDSDDDDGNDDSQTFDDTNKQVTERLSVETDKEMDKDEKSELEEGEVSSDSDSDSSNSEFNDGYDDNLMGDEVDRARLEALSEKERETEIFKRIERRDVMKTRWEIERKLRQAKKAERAKDPAAVKDKKLKEERKKQKERAKHAAAAAAAAAAAKPIIKELPSIPIPKFAAATDKKEDEVREEGEDSDSAPEYFDPKERSKERKKNVEANKTDDKRSNAMAMLKAKREGKQKRGKLFFLDTYFSTYILYFRF